MVIDESEFGKIKYDKYRVIKVRWVIGGIDRSKRFFLEVVNKRDANGLLDVIEKNVQPGSTINTNMWMGYNSLQSISYTHLGVNIG